jgi:putative PEP-CTERM system histidine kinase
MTAISLTQAGLTGYLAAAAGYLVFALLVLFWWEYRLAGLITATASFATSLWATTTAYALYTGHIGWASQSFEIARSCGWLVLLISVLHWVPPVRRSGFAAVLVGFGAAAIGLTLLLGANPAAGLGSAGLRQLLVMVPHLVLAVIGLFAYDFFLYADAVLFLRLNADLFLARGAADVLVLPFLVVYAARNRKAGPTIVVSRRVALHSVTLFCAGLYLMLMAAAGYYVRRFGGEWSGFLQAVFFFGAVLLLVIPLVSGSSRAYLRVLIEKSFFKYKYDYRAEWLRFIETISRTDTSEDLRARVIRAVCDIMESPEGGLWIERAPGGYGLALSWNCSRWELDPAHADIDAQASLVQFLEQKQWVIDLEEFAQAPERYPELSELPEWLRSVARAWLVVPLIRQRQLFGLIIVGRPRVRRDLSWEDFDLLKTVGRQAASYLAEQEASEALAEGHQFEAFNKRFAFVAHDIKNAVSQLSLIVANAARHRDNAAFQEDANETLRQSVEKLNRLLRQLSVKAPSAAPVKAIALAPLLHKIVAGRRDLERPVVSLTVRAETIAVIADEDRLKAIVEHLVQNAVEAVGDDGLVHVRLSGAGKMAVLEVEDNGPGMDADFIRDRLFRPFATTKGTGYGIGVYESREYAASLGGRLDVVSRPGSGTIMRVTLPLLETVLS